MHRISIENFTPASRLVDAKAVVVARHGVKLLAMIRYRLYHGVQKSVPSVFIVIDHQPPAVSIKIQLMQRFMAAIGG